MNSSIKNQFSSCFIASVLAFFLGITWFASYAYAEELGENYEAGNSSINIINGSALLERGEAEDLGIEDEYICLNRFGDYVYYISDSSYIKLQDLTSGETEILYTGTQLSCLYVINDSQSYFIDQGNVYSLSLETLDVRLVNQEGNIKALIPTPEGILYIKGTSSNWSISSDEKILLQGVSQYFTQDGYLVFTQNGIQKQVSLSEVFLSDDSNQASLLNDEVSTDVSELENSQSLIEDADEQEIDLEESQSELVETDENIRLLASQLDSTQKATLTEFQQGVVERAKSICDIAWTALSDVAGWRGRSSNSIQEGETYTGIPYGQPVENGVFVGFSGDRRNIWNGDGVDEFLAAVEDSSSDFYKKSGSYSGITMPYYSLDCSGFLAYCWGMNRITTWDVPSVATKLNPSVNSMQVGDCLNKLESHVVLIEDVVYRSGSVVKVVTVEQTTPVTTRKVWGEGSGRSLADLESAYFSNGYELYRLTKLPVTSSLSGIPNQVSASGPHISYTAHLQNLGWQTRVNDSAVCGSMGKSLRLEALKVSVSGIDASVQYQAYVQEKGWQDWVSDGDLCGTSGESLGVEAIRLKLTGEDAGHYDVYYRVHAQNIGWMGWAKNGEESGTVGQNSSIEAIQILLVEKGDSAPDADLNGAVQTTSETFIYSTPKPSVAYQTHVQNVGWQKAVYNGKVAGTSGKSLRLEAIKIDIANNSYSGGVEYSTHIQNIGWQESVSDNALSGTSGKSLRLEAIKMNLTGELADNFDIYYRVHAQNFGWMGWAKNGEEAGTKGYSYRLEAIQIVLVEKGGQAPSASYSGATQAIDKKFSSANGDGLINYKTHVQNVGWQKYVSDGQVAGTSGRALRLEGIKINIGDNAGYSGGVEYSTHIQNIGWQESVSDNALSGTSGKSLRLEAIKMNLTGELADNFDIYYRVHAQNFGWMGWAKNGEEAGTKGYSYRLEAIQIVLVEKGGQAPSASYSGVTQATEKKFSSANDA